MAIVFPDFEYPHPAPGARHGDRLHDAHDAEGAVELLDLATKIRRHVTEEVRGLDELCAISPIYPRLNSMTPREWLAKFKAEDGVLPKPRITITAAMQRPRGN